jgi:hypothetical protein
MNPVRTLLATTLVVSALAASAPSAPQSETWRHVRPGNTGIQGDTCEAIWIGADDDPYIAGYMPFWEDGGFARFVQDEDRWECWSTYDHPEIGDRDLVGAARIHDITDDGHGKLWMATWRAVVEFLPALGASSLKRWDGANSPHPGGRTMDVEVAPDGTVWASVFSGPPDAVAQSQAMAGAGGDQHPVPARRQSIRIGEGRGPEPQRPGVSNLDRIVRAI